MKRVITVLLAFTIVHQTSVGQTASFWMPDTAGVDELIQAVNLTVGETTNYWNFCSGDLSETPGGNNLGNVGSLELPVFIATGKDGGDYYTFVTNNQGPGGTRIGTISRQYYGNSMLNTPTGVNLGNFGGAIPWAVEGIQIKQEGNNWYGIVVGGGNQSWPGYVKQYTDAIIRLDFGTSLANTPTATNMGNIGAMDFPHDLYVFQDEGTGNWHGLTVNALNSTITRFDFGNSLANTPTGTNLGNIGNLSYPDGIFPIKKNGNWYVFVASRDNASIVRLNFGSSLLNIPTGTQMAGITGINSPRDISIIEDCGGLFGFVVNENTDDIVRLDFPGGITGVPTGTVLGNIGNLDFPHTLSDVFREDDGVYIMIANVMNNTLSRIHFDNCTDASFASSTLRQPARFSYDTPGTYNVSLFIDDGLPTQSSDCHSITIVNEAVLTLPIKLKDFTAKEKEGTVELNWATLSEVNNDFFTIEKSFDGINFEKVVELNGVGNSSTEMNYSYAYYEENKAAVQSGIIYYRLKQTDFDGKSEYFNPIFLEKNSGDMKWKIYPNPSGSFKDMFLSIRGDVTEAQLVDVQGKVIASKKVNKTGDVSLSEVFDIQLNKGMYSLNLQDGQHFTSKRILIQ